MSGTETSQAKDGRVTTCSNITMSEREKRNNSEELVATEYAINNARRNETRGM